MGCELVLEQLPDYALGTLSEIEEAAVRRHLRGCGSCRAEAAGLDRGVSMFADAAHAVDPPPALKERVLGALDEEWAETPARPPRPSRLARLVLSAAAIVLVLAGAVGWAVSARATANANRQDALSYRRFLEALGGRDVRVATLTPARGSALEGSAILYDSDRGQSWVLVLVRSPSESGTLHVALSSPTGRRVALHSIHLASDGDGSTWLVTSIDLSRLNTVRVTSPDGRLLASGIAHHEAG
jgi:Putative zinc-finger